jgi:hypothetical protein
MGLVSTGEAATNQIGYTDMVVLAEKRPKRINGLAEIYDVEGAVELISSGGIVAIRLADGSMMEPTLLIEALARIFRSTLRPREPGLVAKTRPFRSQAKPKQLTGIGRGSQNNYVSVEFPTD